MPLREAAKLAAHASGALAAYHRVRNHRTLTVLMFHRVLPAAERDASGADPLWTISTELFEQVLGYLVRHYNPVGLDDVLAARMRRIALPPRALLMSFDDGWHDNLDYALPLLRRFGVPAAVFVASDAIDEQRTCWWQDVLSWSMRSGAKDAGALWREAGFATSQATSELQLLCRYGELEPARREGLLRPQAEALERRQPRPQMADPPSLRALASAGVAIAVHGASHLPLTELADPAADLQRARERIALHMGASGSVALSFPHGRYDPRIVAAARGLGFKLLFTSDPVINSCPGGWLESDLIGRIPVFAKSIARAGEFLSEPKLATWLFVRPRRILADQAGSNLQHTL